MAHDIGDILKVVVAVVVLVPLLGMFSSLSLGGATSVAPVMDTNVTVDATTNEIPSQVDVSATKENALAFPGEGYVETPQLANGSRSVCVSGRLAGDANQQATYTLYGEGGGETLLQYDAGNWMFYAANASTGDDAKATLAAPNPGAEFRQVCGRYNATAQTVSVSREDTVSAPVALDSSTTRRNTSLDWYGTIDEARTFGEPVPNATLTAYADDPIQPLPSVNRTGRLLMDEGSGGDTHVYFAGTDANIVNATWTDGLHDVSLQEGTDYELVSDPFGINVLSTGYLNGAPVVFLNWSALPFGGMLVSLIGTLLLIGVLIFTLEIGDIA